MPIYKMDGKKDGKQKYRVRINYIDSLGKARQIERVAYGMDSAKQLERELAVKVSEELPSGITVKRLYDEYMKAKIHEVRESTYRKSETNLLLHVLPYLGEMKLDKLSTQVLEMWKQDISSGNYSIRTKKNIFGEFRALLNWGVKMEYIQKNPLLKLGNFRSSMELGKEMDFYTPEEFLKFIKIAKQKAESSESLMDWGFYIFFMIAFYTGMRKGEINALTWEDIKGDNISITKSITQKLRGEDRITPPKNQSSIRCIEIPLPLKDALDAHYKRCSEQESFKDSFFICGGPKALRDTSLQNANQRFADEAGIKCIRIHDFRHSHASLLANEGINIQEIARRLGHSNATITLKTYSHLYPREKERAIKILNKIVDKSWIKE